MKEQGYFHRVSRMTPTRLWINNVTPEEAEAAIAIGATGCTQNPTYPEKMLTHPEGKARAYGLCWTKYCGRSRTTTRPSRSSSARW